MERYVHHAELKFTSNREAKAFSDKKGKKLLGRDLYIWA
jgi:hypothetical protein